MNSYLIVIVWFGDKLSPRKDVLSVNVDEDFNTKDIESCFNVCNKILKKTNNKDYKLENLYGADILLVYQNNMLISSFNSDSGKNIIVSSLNKNENNEYQLLYYLKEDYKKELNTTSNFNDNDDEKIKINQYLNYKKDLN